jgi:hypothetical protein
MTICELLCWGVGTVCVTSLLTAWLLCRPFHNPAYQLYWAYQDRLYHGKKLRQADQLCRQLSSEMDSEEEDDDHVHAIHSSLRYIIGLLHLNADDTELRKDKSVLLDAIHDYFREDTTSEPWITKDWIRDWVKDRSDNDPISVSDMVVNFIQSLRHEAVSKQLQTYMDEHLARLRTSQSDSEMDASENEAEDAANDKDADPVDVNEAEAADPVDVNEAADAEDAKEADATPNVVGSHVVK